MATPAAVSFIDLEALERQTSRPVRSRHRTPGNPRPPRADSIIIAPATFNTINKLANGISDNYALDLVNEAIGLGVPTVILPFINSAYASRTQFQESVKQLKEENVAVLLGPDAISPHQPGSGSNAFPKFPWKLALNHTKTVRRNN